MNKRIYLSAILFLSLIITGCCQNFESFKFSPDDRYLPEGKVNQPYKTDIIFSGSVNGVGSASIISDQGLMIEITRGVINEKAVFIATISGIPSEAKEHLISFSVARYGTMNCSGKNMFKNYTLKIGE